MGDCLVCGTSHFLNVLRFALYKAVPQVSADVLSQLRGAGRRHYIRFCAAGLNNECMFADCRDSTPAILVIGNPRCITEA
jgi:hypothetical protein